MSLASFGFTPAHAQAFAALAEALSTPVEPGRVVRQDRALLRVQTEDAEVLASPSGRLQSLAPSAEELPVVGDWVAVTRGSADDTRHILAVLPRSTLLTRRAPGEADRPQPMAANVDVVLVVVGLDGPVNVRRLERSLTWVWNSGATPVLLLNKADLCADLDAARADVETATAGVDVFVGSAQSGDGLDAVRARLAPGTTALLLGASGAGKSSWVNLLLGTEVTSTAAVRDGDHKGRHTTTHRELHRLTHGALLVDVPGIRELGLWTGDGDGLGEAFADVEALAQQCRFGDCHHAGEPGCAVRDALPAARLESYAKLQRELERLEARTNVHAAQARKAREKALNVAGWTHSRNKRKA